MQASSLDQPKVKILWKLFIGMLYISAFTFGGGFVIINFIKKKFVDELHWLNDDEMLDIIALAQSSPGAIAVNTSILVGWRVAGFWGMIVAVLGVILPPMIIITVISYFYDAFISNKYIALVLKGMQAGVAALILDVAFSLTGNIAKKQRYAHILLMALAFTATFLYRVNVIYLMLGAMLLGLMLSFWDRKRITLR